MTENWFMNFGVLVDDDDDDDDDDGDGKLEICSFSVPDKIM